MTNPGHDPELAGLAQLLCDDAQASVPPEVDLRGRMALQRRLRAEAERVPRARPFYLFGGAVAVAALVALFVLRLRPLSYEVRGARGDGPYIGAPAATPVTVTFADGSSIEGAPGSRLRVDQTRAAGARVLVERGRATVHVAHRTGSAWNFVAGPFDVHVTGTRFDLSWDPSGEAVELRLYEGSVEVRGPLAEAPIAVRAGQRFRADLGARSMTVNDVAAEVATAVTLPQGPDTTTGAEPKAAALPAPSGDTPSAATTELAPARPAPLPASSEPWSALVARGQFETVVAKAGERGTHDCEASCGAADLRALADAARYTGRSAMAEGALKALRGRFGSSKEGRAAAFTLGRLAEARGSLSEAGRWYDTYLGELPGGDLAAEALAGKMRTVMATSGKAAAEPVARKYLSLYPNGVHAQTARGIVGGAPPP
jgi:hypothetical protein